MPTIHYQVSLLNPQAHLIQIRCTIEQADPAGQTISMPAWIPGSYLIRDFARHVVEIAASAGGQAISIRKIDKHTWQCAPCAGSLVVVYSVYAYDLSVRTAYFDTTRAYFNGTSLFVRVHGSEDVPHALEILAPESAYADWQLATAMTATHIDAQGFGCYQANSYLSLIDYPVEIGHLAIIEFQACGVPHQLVISGRHEADLSRTADDLARICTHHIQFFGEPAPFNRYLFLLYAASEDQYGGLEHSHSTSLICPRHWLPVKNGQVSEEDYRSFLGLCSHEYFHAWHVKRIRPQAFKKNELSDEAYSRLLWVFEGFTSYYDTLALVRCGLMTQQQYIEYVGQTITRLLRTPGRLLQSLEDSSFDAWIKLYKPDENTPNSQISYYLKGEITALLLDLTLRSSTSKTLDDVMRLLWQRYGQTGIGMPEDALEPLVHVLTGIEMHAFFEAALRNTVDMPMSALLAEFAIDYQIRTAESDTDKGGKSAATNKTRQVLGVKLAAGNEAKLTHVYSGGAAQQAGLAAGDVIIAVNSLKATAKNLERFVNAYPAGTALQVMAFRRDELMEFQVIPQTAPLDTCVLVLNNKADSVAHARLTSWLST